MSITEIRSNIEGRLAELEDVAERYRNALLALGDSEPTPEPTTPPAEAPQRPRNARRRPSAPKSTPEVVPAEKLKILLTAHPGSTSSELARLANASQNQVLTLLKEMEATGEARREGERRSTRWF